MSYSAIVYRVMIASPSDVINEPEIVREAIREWNAVHSIEKEMVLIPVSWDYDTSPTMGKRPQDVINDVVLDTADLLVAIFWTRIGSPTGNAISGTVEEIQKHMKAGKPTMVYFSKESVKPDKFDKNQYDALMAFKKECERNGLLEVFETTDDFERNFSRHLGIKINTDEYFEQDISGMEFPMDDYADIASNLSAEADLLITEASKDRKGIIQRHAYKGGLDILTNGRKINNAHTPRDVAIWESAFEELIEYELIKEKGYNGSIFMVTQKGFEYIDNKA